MEESGNKNASPAIEELTNEVDEFVHQYASGNSKKRKETYGGKSFAEQKRIFFEEQFAPLDKNPEAKASKFHNPITHTAKVRQTSSGAHVQGRTDAPIPEGYITLSSTQTKESRDYAGASRYATISKVMESTIDGQNKFKDLLDKEDRRLKDFLNFSEERWQQLLQINRLSNKYYTNPRPDALAKQVLFRTGSGDQYLNLTIVPSPILLYEVNERIKERDNREWLGRRMAGKKIGGSNPQNASRLISRVSAGRSELRVLPGLPFEIPYRKGLEKFIRSHNFFRAIRYNHDQHKELFRPFDKLIETNEREGWTPNARVQRALDGSFVYILEQIILIPALSLQDQEPGWSDGKLVRLPEYQRRWLDQHNPKWDPQPEYKERVVEDALACLNRIYSAYRKSKGKTGKDPINLMQDKYSGRFKEIIKRNL